MTSADVQSSEDPELFKALECLRVDEGHDEDDEKGSSTGGYHFDTPAHKAQLLQQRAQLWQWIKTFGRNIMKEGVSLTRVSLPVCLFEARSFLERLTYNWEYMDLLLCAASTSDPVDRMRLVVAFAVGGLCRQTSFHKPFNPILGETYQARYTSGVDVYVEQISHHPPVSSWQVFDDAKKLHFHGNGNWVAGIKGNSVKGRQTGTNSIHFASDGALVTYELPGLTVKGVLWGTRVLRYSGDMKFTDHKHGLECVVSVDPQPQAGIFTGWFRKRTAPVKPDQVTGDLKDRSGAVLDSCSGTWLSHLEWEKGVGGGRLKRVWDIRSTPITSAGPVPHPLLSDAKFREDLVHLKAGDQVAAQDHKLRLEELQRRDRRLRKEGGGCGDH